jgi:DNA polymerase III delta subunit
MIVYLYGPDSYRRQKELNRIIEEYKQKYSNLSYNYFDLENPEEFSRLEEFSGQLLIFDNQKLAVLKNIFNVELEKIKKFLNTYLNDKSFTLLISEEDVPPPALNFLVEKAFLIKSFEYLKGDKWRFFIQKEAQKRNISITPKALNFLAEAFEGDTWGLINELDKIGLIKKQMINADSSADKHRYLIDVSDLEKIGDYRYETPNIFEYINAISKGGSLSKRIVALEKLFLAQEEPVKIFNIFASLKFLPARLIQKLADYDAMVKLGKLDYEEVLLDLVLQ